MLKRLMFVQMQMREEPIRLLTQDNNAGREHGHRDGDARQRQRVLLCQVPKEDAEAREHGEADGRALLLQHPPSIIVTAHGTYDTSSQPAKEMQKPESMAEANAGALLLQPGMQSRDGMSTPMPTLAPNHYMVLVMHASGRSLTLIHHCAVYGTHAWLRVCTAAVGSGPALIPTGLWLQAGHAQEQHAQMS